MKLIVTRRDGQQETLSITLPAITERHDESPLWSILCADGMQHYFTIDGHYDGWGMDTEGQNLSWVEAATIIKSIEEARLINGREREAKS